MILFHDDPGCPGHTTGAPVAACQEQRQLTRCNGEATEYGLLMSGGGVHVRNDDPGIEHIYPLVEWIKDHNRDGGKVLKRRIIVLEDWTEASD